MRKALNRWSEEKITVKDVVISADKTKSEKRMSRYRETSKPYDISFEDLEIIERLLKTKKLTDRQKEAVKSLLKYYYSKD